MSCEICGREIKNYGVFLGGIRCINSCERNLQFQLQFCKTNLRSLLSEELHILGREEQDRKTIEQIRKMRSEIFRIEKLLEGM